MKELPVYKIVIDEENEQSGIEFVSLVQQPAIMVKGLAFNDTPIKLEFKYDNDKQIIAGPAIIPDMKIYRYDDEIGEFYVYFEKEMIEKMVDRFNKLPKEFKINLDHSDKIAPAFIKGSWIIENKEYDKSKMYGFDLPEGTWFIEVKVEDKDFWAKEIKKGEKYGFSIEGFMNIALSMQHNRFEIKEGGVASSNVRSYRYNTNNNTLILEFNDGSRYKYWAIDDQEFEDIILGNATCITAGSNFFGRWYVGKSPSVGAAVWKYLRERNVRYAKLSATPPNESIEQQFETYNDYPQAARDNACKVLRWRDEHGEDEVDGMTRVGWIRANQLCGGENISEDTIARMAGFERHRENSEIAEEYKGTPWKDRGYVAWLGWGGTEGIEWASRKLLEIRQEMAEVGERGAIVASPKAPKSSTPNTNPQGEGTAKGDASSTRGAEVSERVEKILKEKSDDFNERYKEKLGYGVNVGMLKSVYQRGVGAYNVSHSPNVASAEQWALARVNAFLYLVKTGRPENKKYTGDNDLLPTEHPKRQEMSFAKVSFDVDGVLTTKTGRDLLRDAIQNGDEIFIISARNNKDGIVEQFKEFKIPSSNIFATGSNDKKIAIIKELGIEKHYDDNPDVIDELGRIGIKLQINNKQTNNFFMKKRVLKFAEYMLEDGTKISVEGELAVGSPVFVVKEDGSLEQAPAGSHTLEDGTEIFVDEEGLINEVRSPETAAIAEGEQSLQVTPEEVMAVVAPMFEEMKAIIAELQSRIDMLEGKTGAAAEILKSNNDEFGKEKFNNITMKLERLKSVMY